MKCCFGFINILDLTGRFTLPVGIEVKGLVRMAPSATPMIRVLRWWISWYKVKGRNQGMSKLVLEQGNDDAEGITLYT